MFSRTSHKLAPWEVIASEQKRFARIAVLETVIERVEQGMKRWGLEVPPPVEKVEAAAES